MNDATIPAYPLVEEDRIAFHHLGNSFNQKLRSVKDDRHTSSFTHEIQSIINFVERRFEERDSRAINAGFVFFGAYICVNTRQLKKFISRCKSSINSGLQQLGYTAIKNRSKTHEYLINIIPTLSNDMETARQWTVRYNPTQKGYPFILKRVSHVVHPIPIIKKCSPLVMPQISLHKHEGQSQPENEWGFETGNFSLDNDYSIQETAWDFSINSTWL